MKNNQKFIISLSNELNTMAWRRGEMTLQALRIVFLYLSLINPLTPDFTDVTVHLSSYALMLGVELNECAIGKSCQLLREYKFKFGEPLDGMPAPRYSFFSICQLSHRKSDGALVVELKCSDEIKNHIFELRQNYTSFSATNVFKLNDLRAIRLYMLLAQYRVIKRRTITLVDLKRYLGIDDEAYAEFKLFSRDVLKTCQTALKKHTDITFTFRSVGRPTHSVLFEISGNLV